MGGGKGYRTFEKVCAVPDEVDTGEYLNRIDARADFCPA